MNRIRQAFARIDMYDGLSFGLMGVLLILALSYWGKFPVHMDTFYHMGVTSGYTSAGGVALHSFWEFAPAGRAQLYPPLLHIFMFAFSKAGLSAVSVGRLVSFGAYPCMLLSSWYGMRKIFSSRAAFYTTVLMGSVYLLFWHTAVESAASLVLIFTPLVFVAVERDRKVAAAVLLALALYSHLTLGHLVAFGLLIYAVHRREKFKEIAIVLVGAYLLWLPWGIHILVNYKSLSFTSPGGGGGGISLHLLVWGVALAGFVYCYFKKGKYYLLPSFLLGFIPIVFFYSDRFWNAHVFMPLAMLGGVALAGAHGWLTERAQGWLRSGAARKALVGAVMAVPVVLLLLVDPVFATGGKAPSQPGVMGGQGIYSQQGIGGQQQGLPPFPPGGQLPPGMRQSVPQPGQGQQIVASSQTYPGTPPPQPSPVEGEGVPGVGSPVQGEGVQGVPPLYQGEGTLAGQGGKAGAGAPMGPGGRSGLRNTKTLLLTLIESDNEVVGSNDGNRFGMMAMSQSLGKGALIDSDILALADMIEENSEPDDIVFAPDGGIGNLITGLTGRASTSGMFHEVSSDERTQSSTAGKTSGPTQGMSSIENASIIVAPTGQTGGASAYGVTGNTKLMPNMVGRQAPGAQGSSNIDTSKLELIGTVGNYSVYRNTAATASASVSGTVIPWYAVYSLLALALLAILIDWFRPGKGEPELADGGPEVGAGPEPGGTPGGGAGGWGYGSGGFPPDAGLRGPPRANKVLAIVPCYNEAGNVGKVVRELRRVAPLTDVLVVDDGSKDWTAAAALGAGAAVFSHDSNEGIGAAVRTGMCYALERGYRFAVQVDGDGQHDPAYIAALLSPLEAGEADLVVGSRFLGTNGYRPPFARRVGTLLLSRAVSLVTRCRATDTSSGFRAMNRRALSFLAERYPDDYAETESLVLLSRAGLRWAEVPVSMRARTNGYSSIRGFAAAVFMTKVLWRITLDTIESLREGSQPSVIEQSRLT